MLESAKRILEKINNSGYKAYLVGGFVRNYLLGIESSDVDITTNATPKELQKIFIDSCLPSTDYGAVIVNYHGIRFEITTFRREISYVNNRKPMKIEYIDSLEEDLKRRDFTINTICMDKDGNIIDLLNGKTDLDSKLIKTVGEASKRFEEDCLRILRAIRFAATLSFSLDKDIKEAIVLKKGLLKNLSYNRKKEELDKIFSSTNIKEGINLLLKYELDKELELNKLSEIKNTDSLITIWSILDVEEIYPFTNTEKELIKNIKEALNLDNYDKYVLYKYGLYVNQQAGNIKGLDKKKITKLYNSLPIKSKKDLDITSEDIIKIMGKEPGEYIKTIYKDLEKQVISSRLKNKKKVLIKYINNNKEKYY